jgi:hypothetical protein
MVISFHFLLYDFSGRYCPNTGLIAYLHVSFSREPVAGKAFGRLTNQLSPEI